MWIEKLENGKFKAVERYEDYLTGKTKRVSITFEKNTPQERKKIQAALTRKINKKQKEDTGTHEITLEELVEEYRRDQAKTVKASTYKRNFHACNTFMIIFGKDTLVSRLDARIIRTKFLETEKEPGTLNEHLTRLKALLRWGYKNDLIKDISYLDKIEKFKDIPHKEKIQDKFMESEEVTELLFTMTVEKWHDLTKFLILSGLRIGEALALSINDVDIDRRMINVDKNYDLTNDTIVDTPKNEPSIREVYIQDELLPLCKKIRGNALPYRLKNGIDVLFQDDNGRYEYWAFNKYLKAKTKALLGRELTPHALRHTHASLLTEQGVGLDVISRRLGHEDSTITKEIYIHITKKLKKQDSEKLTAIKLL